MAKDRIHGPYKHRNKWRLFEVAADGTRSVVSFASWQEALDYKATVERQEVGARVSEAVRDYIQHLRDQPGKGGVVRRDSTLKLVEWRLRGLLRLPEQDMPLSCLNRSEMGKLFKLREGEVKPDTLIGELNAVRRWAQYEMAEGHMTLDPTVGLVVRGERSAGKPQLRVDEARRFLGSALADETAAGTAAALALLTGMRASEVTGLVVHDLDDGGRLLWVADNMVRRLKTRKRRQLEVPLILQDRLRALAAGRPPEAQLFGDVHRHWLAYHVHRLCEVAGVPTVSPHGLRGTWATLARGVMPTEQVAATIGNRPEVSATAYIAPGAAASADAKRVGATVTPWETARDVPSPTPASLEGDLLN
jgi:integrase